MSLAKNQDPSKSNLQSDSIDASSEIPNTMATVLTGVGRSAIAVIAVAGISANEVITSCFVPSTSRPFSDGQIRYGTWCGKRDLGGDLRDKLGLLASGESVVVVPISSEEFEIHCHGGIAATTRIMNDLQSLGVVVVDTNHPAWNPTKPVVIREAEEILARCLTTRTAAVAMDQVRGALRDWCESILTPEKTSESQDIAAIRQVAQAMLENASFGLRLADRFSVVLAGPPNVGKSSLINAIVGYDRSITMDLAGTTRDVLHADTIIDGIAVRLSDTAGMRQSAGVIEHQGILKAHEAAQSADVVVWVSEPGKDHDSQQIRALETDSVKVIRVLNKADLATSLQPVSSSRLETIATTGAGVDELMQAIWDAAVGSFPPPGTPVPMNQRQNECLAKIAASTQMDECRKWTEQLLLGRASI